MTADASNKQKLPAGYTRPSIEEWLKAGYGRDAVSAEDKKIEHKAYFDDFEASLAANYKAGLVDDNGRVSKPAATGIDGLPDSLTVVSQVRRVATRTARATSPTRHRFKQYLFGNQSLRLIRKGKLNVLTGQVLDNLDELREKERQGLLSVHTADGRRVDLAALAAGSAVLADPRMPAPEVNRRLDSAAFDDPSGNQVQTYLDGTFPGDPAAARAVKAMEAEKLAEQGVAPKEDEPIEDPAAVAQPEEDESDPVDESTPSETPESKGKNKGKGNKR